MTSSKARYVARSLTLSASLLMLAIFASAADTPPGVDARADEICARWRVPPRRRSGSP
jgi:hypothetical protein